MGKLFTLSIWILLFGTHLAAINNLQSRLAVPQGSPSSQHPHYSRPRSLEIATSSTVQVSYPVVPGGDRVGSGVWVSEEGYVATCWHVVKDATGQVIVNVSLAVYNKNLTVTASFYTMNAHVVAHDETADVAILKVENNPFTNPPSTFIKTPKSAIRARFAVPRFRQQVPDSGEQVVLAGFPLGRPDLISQTGIVAGMGIPGEIRNPAPIARLVRVFASVVSNPANSGGPVLDSSGQLIGILEGNLPSLMRDEQGRDVLYYRPRRDPNGTPISDQNGNVQNEIAPLYQNSGISVIVPVEFVVAALKEARAIVAASTAQQLQRMAPHATPYSALPNQQLRTATLGLVSEIRQFMADKRLAEDRFSDAQMAAVAQAKSDAERRSLWSSYNDQRTQLYELKLAEFNSRFKMKAIWLQNELLIRLPAVNPDPRVHYERIVGDFDVEGIAGDLERLAGELR
jgi:S1-C subfamily serine protease